MAMREPNQADHLIARQLFGGDFHPRRESTESRTAVYNRYWHLDLNNRRHLGRRKWEQAALEALVDLAGQLDWLYPPDFSNRHAVRFRAAGRSDDFLVIRTSRPRCLMLQLHPATDVSSRTIQRTKVPFVRAPRPQFQITLLGQVDSPAFRRFFNAYARRMRAAFKAAGVRPSPPRQRRSR